MAKHSSQKPDDPRQKIKPGREKVFQVERNQGSLAEQEFIKDASARKYSKSPAKVSTDEQESLREEEKLLQNEGSENLRTR